MNFDGSLCGTVALAHVGRSPSPAIHWLAGPPTPTVHGWTWTLNDPLQQYTGLSVRAPGRMLTWSVPCAVWVCGGSPPSVGCASPWNTSDLHFRVDRPKPSHPEPIPFRWTRRSNRRSTTMCKGPGSQTRLPCVHQTVRWSLLQQQPSHLLIAATCRSDSEMHALGGSPPCPWPTHFVGTAELRLGTERLQVLQLGTKCGPLPTTAAACNLWPLHPFRACSIGGSPPLPSPP